MFWDVLLLSALTAFAFGALYPAFPKVDPLDRKSPSPSMANRRRVHEKPNLTVVTTKKAA